MKVLTFSVADLRVGIDIADVVESVRAVDISPLPGCPAVVEGLIDFRGTIAPVFDMRLRLLGLHVDIAPEHVLIIANVTGVLVALHVDAVHDLVSLDAQTIQSAGPPTVVLPHVVGVAALPDGLLVIHDLTTFLSLAERESLDAALDGAGVAR